MQIFISILLGLFFAIVTNISFAFKNEILSFQLAAFLYLILGYFIENFPRLHKHLLLAISCTYFFVLFTLPWNYIFLLICIPITFGFYTGVFLKGKSMVSVLGIIVFCISSSVFYFLPEYIFNAIKLSKEGKIKNYNIELNENFLTIDSSSINKNQFLGKIVLIEYWHIKCGACKLQFQLLDELQKQYLRDTNVAIVAINCGLYDSFSDFKKFGETKFKYDFTLLYENDANTYRKLNFNSSPHTFLLDKKGKIERYFSGYSKVDHNVVKNKIINDINSLNKK
jgi:thiol-disulfide isomerase/thioredoxin